MGDRVFVFWFSNPCRVAIIHAALASISGSDERGSVVTERDSENESSALEALIKWVEVHGVRQIACR